MREFFDLANNPLFVKHFRSRLRRTAVLPGVIITCFLSMSIIFFNNFALKGPNNPDPTIGSQMFFWLQGILLVVMGGSQVASAIAQMKESGIIDFHRITPVPPAVQAVGIMVGAPIRELIMYAATLPFALFLAIDGPVGVGNFCKLLLVQLGGALMYYSLAMITGLTASRARGASGRFVGVLVGLNIFSTSAFPAGVYGPTLLTSVPVYYEVFYEKEVKEEKQRIARRRAAQQGVLPQQQMNKPGQNPPPMVNPAPAVPPPADDDEVNIRFYGLDVPVVLQSLLFQGSVLTFLFIAASRRIHSARLPLFRKASALLFYLTVSVLTLGSLWDSELPQLTLGGVYFLTFFAVVLTNTITPLLGDVVKGLQRARKLSAMRVPMWSDLSTNKFVVAGFALLMITVLSIGIPQAKRPAMPVDFHPWAVLTVGALTVLAYGFVAQYFPLAFGNRSRSYFTVFAFFAWIVPAIIGMLAKAADVNESGYLLALTPVVGIFAAGGDDLWGLDPQVLQIASIAPTALFAVLFGVLVVSEERRMSHEVAGEPERRILKRREPTDVAE